jgi:hypothetical protein
VTTAEIEASRLCWAGGCEHARSGFACEACIAAALLAAEQRGARDWQRLSALQDRLLVAYRLGGRPPGKVLDEMAKLRARLAAPSPGEEPR